MTEEKAFNVDPSWKGVIKWGGLSLFVAGFMIVPFVLWVLISQQTLPLPAEEFLEDPVGPTAFFLLPTIGELLLLPGFMALYFSLKDVKKAPMLIATGLLAVAVPMFLTSRGLIIALSQISNRYLDTTSEVMKAAYLASAELAIETQNIYAAMGLILLSVASIIVGRVMLKGVFGKRIGYVAIAAGILSISSPFAVMMGVPLIIPFIGLILMAYWQIVVGVKLYKLG
ncbi:MAG: hypothetical protein KAV87_44950 [Desulfobacteraceae bacterium]|nr:hypothetical protein [Desulfobacteraceae bacterium]